MEPTSELDESKSTEDTRWTSFLRWLLWLLVLALVGLGLHFLANGQLVGTL